MNILLLSMPDSFEHMAPVAIRMPNGALTSLAGNIDRHHAVAVADLILVHDRVLPTVERLLRDHQPHVVGLSIMTFQRRTALRLIAHIKQWRPDVDHRRGRIRSEPGGRCVCGPRLRRGCGGARGRGDDVSGAGARAGDARGQSR